MNDLKKELEQEIDRVKHRVQILNLIEEKLYEMKKLAQYVKDTKLNEEEQQKINKQFKSLEEQVQLLNAESSELS